MSRFSPSFISSLNNADIATLLTGQGVKLGKTGGNQRLIECISPKHDDGTPSMSVNLASGAYHCHGCGVSGGGCIDMYAEMTGMDKRTDFKEIVIGLSSVLGVQPEYENSESHRKAENLKAALFGVVQESMKTPYFEDDRKALTEFAEKREISTQDRQHAKIGFIPANFAKSPFAIENKDLLIEAGILKVSEKTGNTYSPFGGRITFPITNEQGEVIAIAGRRIDSNHDDKSPKYINSNESLVFKKSHTLYGMYSATKAAEAGEKLKSIIVVEGYMDAITSQTRGAPETVASMGTALTSHHIKMLAKKTDSVIFVFDPDDAGKKAATRAMLNALPFVGDLDFKIAVLPSNESEKLDPDALIKTKGINAYRDTLSNAIPIVDYAAAYTYNENGGKAESVTLMELLKGGLEERASDVFGRLPEGIARPLIACELARAIGKKLDLTLTPEQLGMRIDYEARLVAANEVNNELRKEMGLRGDLPKPEAAQVAQNSTSAAPIAPKAPEHEKPQAKPATQENDSTSVKGTVVKVAPFSFAPFNNNQIASNGDWLLLKNGTFANVISVTNGQIEASTIRGEKINIESNYLKITPERVVSSKYNTSNAAAGDKILLLCGKWLSEWSNEHYNMATALLAEGKEPKRQTLESAALLALNEIEASPANLQASIQAIRSMSEQELKVKVGFTQSAFPSAQAMSSATKEPAIKQEKEKMPEGFLIKAAPREKDFVTCKELGGAVLVVENNENGRLILKNPNDNTTHEIKDFANLYILKTQGRTLSKIDSQIAHIGQPIFKAEKEGAWLASVPMEWIEKKDKTQEKKHENSPSL